MKENKQKFNNIFDKVQNYGIYRPNYPPEVLDSIIEYHGDQPTDSAYDIACGTGQLTFDLTRFFKRVVGVEPSGGQRSQIKEIKERCDKRCEEISFIEGTAEKIPLNDESADLVTVAQAIHWFDINAFFKESNRLLKKNGTIAVVGYGTPFFQDFEDGNQLWRNCYFNDIKQHFPINQFNGKSIRDPIDEEYKNINLPFKNVKRVASKIEKNMTAPEFFDYLDTMSAVVILKSSNKASIIPDFQSNLIKKLQFTKKKTFKVIWPIFTLLGKK